MADEMNVTAVTLKRWENEDGIPGKAAQEQLISICQKEKIDLAEVVEESIREQAQEIAKSNPYREILFHGSESGLKGNISLANRICRDYRREGKYFDEIIDSARQKQVKIMDSIELKLCDIQGRLFELAWKEHYNSERFIVRLRQKP